MKSFWPLLASFSFAMSTFGSEKKEIVLKNDGGCFNVTLDQGTGDVFSCTEKPKITYQASDCETKKVLERADVEAHIHCPDDEHFKIEFKTSSGVVSALLDLKRDSKGRKGTVTSYKVHESSFSKADPHQEVK